MADPVWTPVRYVHHAVRCDFCWNTIPKGSPGSRVGDRGTRAWICTSLGLWECMPCRTEGFRAESVRQENDLRAT